MRGRGSDDAYNHAAYLKLLMVLGEEAAAAGVADLTLHLLRAADSLPLDASVVGVLTPTGVAAGSVQYDVDVRLVRVASRMAARLEDEVEAAASGVAAAAFAAFIRTVESRWRVEILASDDADVSR